MMERQMRLVKVKQSFYELIKKNHVDEEIVFNECGSPCVLIMDLEYKGLLRKFVVPLRSNISTKTPHNQYFPLVFTQKLKKIHFTAPPIQIAGWQIMPTSVLHTADFRRVHQKSLRCLALLPYSASSVAGFAEKSAGTAAPSAAATSIHTTASSGKQSIRSSTTATGFFII